MRKLIVFNQVSLDGYFTDVDGDMSWAHKQDAEWNAFVAENARSGGELLFGRITYISGHELLHIIASHCSARARRRVSGSAGHSGADRTSDRAGAAQE